jgi:glycosyltransferase involved in cell wall biosynthesis
VKQGLENIEIILVDDCSTDKTGQIADNFSNKISEIKVIHLQQNCGPSAARNAGLKLASGKYVYFPDADDTLYPETFDYFRKILNKYDVDAFSFGYDAYMNGSFFRKYVKKGISEKLFEGETFCRHWLSKNIDCNVYNVIYNVGELNKYNCSYPEDIRINEDIVFLLNVLPQIQNVLYDDRICYSYKIRTEGSLTSTFRKNYERKHIDGFLKDKEYANKIISKKLKLERYVNFFIARLYVIHLQHYLLSKGEKNDFIRNVFIENKYLLNKKMAGKFSLLCIIQVLKLIPIKLLLGVVGK